MTGSKKVLCLWYDETDFSIFCGIYTRDNKNPINRLKSDSSLFDFIIWVTDYKICSLLVSASIFMFDMSWPLTLDHLKVNYLLWFKTTYFPVMPQFSLCISSVLKCVLKHELQTHSVSCLTFISPSQWTLFTASLISLKEDLVVEVSLKGKW